MSFIFRRLLVGVLLLNTGCWSNAGDNSEPGPAPVAPEVNRNSRTLIGRLDGLKVAGPSRGGPYVGILPNDLTTAIVKEGERAVPELVVHLDRANYAGTVYTVYCLHELKAKAAKERVQTLQQVLERGQRFAEEPHDLTLAVEIQSFLEDADSW